MRQYLVILWLFGIAERTLLVLTFV